MMRLQQITATPHPGGNQINLSWNNPSPVQYSGVRVVRREDTHPTTPNDGTLVKEGEGLEGVEDSGLKGETVYYYTLFPYRGSQQYHFDPHNRISAMATAPYNTAEQMYDLIPAIYHRYDAESGQLRRFLDLPGEQFDQLYSFATALLNIYNLDRTDGRLLPLLAEWIGWQTDYRIEIAKQRNEIRYAPYLYQTMGLIQTLEATVKRFIGWESRTKEFVHNIFRSNCPEHLNIWLRQRKSNGEWSQPTKPLSLNFAYEGRTSAVRDRDGTIWLFYHTLKQDRWEIWYKTHALNASEDQWTPSQPLNGNARSIEKYPTAAFQGSTLWVFWSTYAKAIFLSFWWKWYLAIQNSQPVNGVQLDWWFISLAYYLIVSRSVQTENRWQVKYRTHTNAGWSAVRLFSNDRGDRRQPWAVTDTSNGLWLFWIESFNGQQQLKYNRHNGSNWQLTDAATFPLASREDPRAVNDVFVIIHPTDSTQPLWVFWARQEPLSESSQTRWQVVYRVKQGLDPTVTSDWSEVRTLPWAAAGNDDREPSAMVREDGSIELFWSSTRSGGWSIWHTSLNTTTHAWGTVEPITTGPYSHRAPLCVADPNGTLLMYGSNQSLSYVSQTYGATDTTDFRYAGCTTVDTRNLTKLNLREQFDDFQTYTSVITSRGRPKGLDDDNWYAWYARQDTVGLYLTPTTEDPVLLQRDQELLQNILPQFQPIQARVEFFPQLAEGEERYNTIQEVKETLAEDIGVLSGAEIYSNGSEIAVDRIPEWQLFMTNTINHVTVNSAIAPINVRSRTWHSAITYLPDPDGGNP